MLVGHQYVLLNNHSKTVCRDTWESAASLFDFADDEAQTPVEKLQSLNSQINDGSIQFVKDGDTLSQIASFK
jgi:hypothetical protein